MKNFAIIAIGLALLSVGASAQETLPSTRIVKITIGEAVTTMQMPPILNKDDQSLSIQSEKIERNQDTCAFNGHVTLNYGEGFIVTSDKGSVNLNNRKITMSGNVVIQYEQDGKQIIRIVAESATIEADI